MPAELVTTDTVLDALATTRAFILNRKRLIDDQGKALSDVKESLQKESNQAAEYRRELATVQEALDDALADKEATSINKLAWFLVGIAVGGLGTFISLSIGGGLAI